jgi:hypothetical protein
VGESEGEEEILAPGISRQGGRDRRNSSSSWKHPGHRGSLPTWRSTICGPEQSFVAEPAGAAQPDPLVQREIHERIQQAFRRLPAEGSARPDAVRIAERCTRYSLSVSCDRTSRTAVAASCPDAIEHPAIYCSVCLNPRFSA